MSNKRWTKEQEKAIYAPTSNLLVAAAAGAGKTAVLVERIINKLMDEKNPVDIDRMLIVTFTNAAAAEMRERIGSAIEKMLDGNKHSKHLQRQLTLLNKANITTMHSFCLEVIRNNFHSIELDPAFRIADDTEGRLLKLEALEELFEERYEEVGNRKEFLDLVESYGKNKDDMQLQEIVQSIYEFVQSTPWPERWLNKASESFHVKENYTFDDTPWIEVLKNDLRTQISGALTLLQKAVRIINETPELSAYLSTFQDNVLEVEGLLKNCDTTWESLYNSFHSLNFGKLSGNVKQADPEVKEKVKELRDVAKKEIEKIKKNIFWADPVDTVQSLKELYPLMKCLEELVIDFGRLFAEKKKEKGLLDFSDLEHYCLKILTENEKIADTFKDRFEDIFVDEYQDSNDVQEEILSKISREKRGNPNIFMVGDVKQSIYRFRQAKPEIFMSKYRSYSEEEKKSYRKIKLFKNFRSRANVIHGVNFIFKQIMSMELGELKYDNEEALHVGADYPPYAESSNESIELHLIDYKEIEGEESAKYEEDDEEDCSKDEEEEETPDRMQAEARIIGKRIRELIRPERGEPFQVYDGEKKDYRNASYKDIVILLRATKNWSEIFTEELARMEIPVYADSGTGYFKTTEIQTIMALLNIIDNPMQDIPLLSVLRSPICGFRAEELVDIRMLDIENSFYLAMKKALEENALNSTLMEKLILFFNNLDKWREKARYTPTDELIWVLYQDTGYYGYVGSMPGGIQRQANLRILFQRAKQYEETAYKGLFNFINFINKMQSSRGDLGSAKILGENEDVVRIMSIHKSKGLEFPIVITAGLGKGFNFMDLNKNIILHQELGFGPDYVNFIDRIQYPSIAKEAIRSKIKVESLSEEMRILYVAFTRAKEKLILTGSTKNLEKAAIKWNEAANIQGEKLSTYQMMKGKNFLDWICPALIRHKACTRLTMFEENDANCFDDPSKWEVYFYDRSHIGLESKAAMEEEKVFEFLEKASAEAFDLEKKRQVSERLDWQYPYIAAASIPAKVSVSELKNQHSFEEETISTTLDTGRIFVPPLVKKPQFLQEEKELSGAEKGTAMHIALQHIDINHVAELSAIKLQIDSLVEKEILLKKEREAVNDKTIHKFFQTELGNRMAHAMKLYREAPFQININCREVYPVLPVELYENETIMLQGVIDCYFEEEDGLVLLDYKTGRMKEEYKEQLNLYAMVLENATGKKVKEKIIVMLPLTNSESIINL